MEIRLFSPEIKEAWDSFVTNRADGTFYHLSGWKNVFERTYGHRTFYLYAAEEKNGPGEIAGVLPLVLLRSRLFGTFLVSLPIFDHVGICSESEEARKGLAEEAIKIGKEEGARFVELRQMTPLTQDPDERWSAKTHKVTLLLDLPRGSENFWNSLKSKLRSQIKKPIKEGCKFVLGGKDQIDNFYEVFSNNMRDLGTPVNSKGLFQNILEEFPDCSRVGSVLLNEKPVASGFILGFKGKLCIPWASSIKKMNHLSANMLLYWGILEYACNQGYEIFDFGRSTPGEGTHKFKEQWSPRTVPLYWHYWIANGNEQPELNPDNPKFRLFIKIWQNLPIPVANLIGPRIVKYLPQ